MGECAIQAEHRHGPNETGRCAYLNHADRIAFVHKIEGDCDCSTKLKSGHFHDCRIAVCIDFIGALQDSGYRLVKP